MMLLRIALFIGVLITLSSANSDAQWVKTQDQLLDIKWDPQSGGALEFHDGILWATCKDVFYSRDTGLTWRLMPRFIQDNDWITTIRFFGDTGLVATADGHLWRTLDNGNTWTKLFEESMIAGVTFAGSGHDMLVLLAAPGDVQRSTDGGSSWQHQNLDLFGQDIISSRGLSLATVTDFDHAHLWNSLDTGATWHEGGTGFNFDSYGLSVDSCTNNVYVVNEEERNPLDGICKILVTTDLGNTWSQTFTHDREYLAGAIAAGPTVLYASTLVDGVLRSTDHGATWQSIGGPNIREDTRFLLPIDDNIVIAVDQDGSIWRTLNSGGSPITVPESVFSLSKSDLFSTTTLNSCAVDSDEVVLARVIGACNGPLEVVRQEITGPDAGYYTILDTVARAAEPFDTLRILFAPDSSRDYHASLVLTLWNGETRTVALGGHGTTAPHIVLSSENISTDVIGDVITVPIKSSAPIERSADIRLRFDPAELEFQRIATGFPSVSILSQSTGEIVLHVSGANTLATDSSVAALLFRFLPVTAATTTIGIDSLTYAPDSACGDYVATTATITSTADICSRQILARFVKNGETPQLSITPNPASDHIWVASDRDCESTVRLYNDLGELLTEKGIVLGRTPGAIDVSRVSEGMVTVTVDAGGLQRSYRILVLHE